MPPAIPVQLPIALFGLAGAAVVIGRLREGRCSPAQWLALACFGAWSTGAGFDVVWPLLARAGADIDLRHLVVNLLRVGAVLAVSLLMTTFGIRERLRPVMVVAAIAAGLIVWWVPGHGAILQRAAQADWDSRVGMGLYLGYIAGTVGCLLELGRARYRTDLHLAKQLQLRLLQAMAIAALAYVLTKALLFVGVQAGWTGFSVETAAVVLPVLLLVFSATLWLALAPPNALVRLAARIEQANTRAFATYFALQTKDDLVRGHDLGRRSALISLAEQMAREQGFGFDDLARLRLAAVLLHTNLDLRPTGSVDLSDWRTRTSTVRRTGAEGLHTAIAGMVWVPEDVLRILGETESPAPLGRATRSLKVIDAFVEAAYRSGYPNGPAGDAVRALGDLEHRFAGWPELKALRRVIHQDGAI